MHLSGIKRCKKTHQCLECFHRRNLDRPISQWEALLLQSICAFKEQSPYSHAYRVLFPKTAKIHLHCTAGHPVSVCAHSQPMSTDAIYKNTCIISEGNGWLFSQVARCWKEEHAACPSPSMVPAAMLHDGTSPLLRQAPLRRSCRICIGVNMLDPTPLAGHPESNLQKDIMAGKRNPIAYYKVTDNWLIASQTLRMERRGSFLLVASIIRSTPATGAEDVFSPSQCVDGLYLKQVGYIHGLLYRQTWRLLCSAEELNWWESLNQLHHGKLCSRPPSPPCQRSKPSLIMWSSYD